MIICPQIKNGRMYGKIETSTILEPYDEVATLINADGIVTSATGGNGWVIYQQGDYAETFLMLNATANTSYPRWQASSPNVFCYLKTPQKGIITHYTTTQWYDGTASSRICNHWIITGYETEADLLALQNGTVIDDNYWTSVAKGTTKTCYCNKNKAFEYYSIHMISNFAGGSWCSMGATKFYMRLPNKHEVETKKFKLFGKRR